MTDFPSYPGGQGQGQSPDPYPGGPQPYPGAPPPYPSPGGQQPYPGGQPPYPGGQPPYPGGQPPFPGGQPSYPGGPMPGEPSLFGGNQAPRPPLPPSVINAVKLMYVGAGLSVLVLIFSIITVNSTRTKLRKALPNDTTAQINTAVHAYVIGAVIGGLIGVGLWIWMANKNKAGRNWARILGTVFFGISTLEMFYSLVEHISVLDKLVAVVIWLVGVVIVVLLWRRESSDYFKPKPQSTW